MQIFCHTFIENQFKKARYASEEFDQFVNETYAFDYPIMILPQQNNESCSKSILLKLQVSLLTDDGNVHFDRPGIRR